MANEIWDIGSGCCWGSQKSEACTRQIGRINHGSLRKTRWDENTNISLDEDTNEGAESEERKGNNSEEMDEEGNDSDDIYSEVISREDSNDEESGWIFKKKI